MTTMSAALEAAGLTSTSSEAEGSSANVVALCSQIEDKTEFDATLPFLVVTHIAPDTDALACQWFVDKILTNELKSKHDTVYKYVRSGERLPAEECAGYNIVHVDTGLGRFDQHGKNLTRASSFQLLVSAFGYEINPAIQVIMELTMATDNVERVDNCSVHNVFKALRWVMKQSGSREPDWDAIRQYAFTAFDALYAFHDKKDEGEAKFERYIEKNPVEELPCGIKFLSLGYHSGTRQAAFDHGVDVVMWFNNVGSDYKLKYVGIQVNEKSPVKLGNVVSSLRFQEAKRRGQRISHADCCRIGNVTNFPTWFIHDSGNLILAGSNTHPLREGEHSRIGNKDIIEYVRKALQSSSPNGKQ